MVSIRVHVVSTHQFSVPSLVRQSLWISTRLHHSRIVRWGYNLETSKARNLPLCDWRRLIRQLLAQNPEEASGFLRIVIPWIDTNQQQQIDLQQLNTRITRFFNLTTDWQLQNPKSPLTLTSNRILILQLEVILGFLTDTRWTLRFFSL